MRRTNKIEKCQEKINYKFKNITLLKIALTHSSALVENSNLVSYERLEYLGDAVLELLTAQSLYYGFPKENEGWMTKIRAAVVSEPPLADIAVKAGLDEYLILGKGTEKTGGRKLDSILSDSLEALIGALYIDGGLESARSFIMPYIDEKIQEAKEHGFSLDYKTRLQELLQKNGEVDIEYILLNESGPPHDRVFRYQITADNKILGEGEGKSKKISQQEAAKKALKHIN